MKTIYLLGVFLIYQSEGFSFPCVALALTGAGLLFLASSKIKIFRKSFST